MDHLIKTGSSSVVLGSFHYNDFIQPKGNKLLKITKIIDRHNEFRHLNTVRSIKGYNLYYSIPDEAKYLLKPTFIFYGKLEKLLKEKIKDANEMPNIFNKGTLQCNLIDNAGDKDMFETIHDLLYDNFGFWKSYRKIYHCATQLLKALSFLHDNQLCHLDIKPENIMVDTKTFLFRIIDFGFCSKEPFNDFVFNPIGTTEYFPQTFQRTKIDPWLPQIHANDMVVKNRMIPMLCNRQLVYKIDSYCLGRTLYFLKYLYDDRKVYSCYNNEKKLGRKLDGIIGCLLENDVYKRLTVAQCIDKFNIN
tara:strand:- start:262 stop:1176 length:915 start_codon:yes stop_codon:yes gene_type:complete